MAVGNDVAETKVICVLIGLRICLYGGTEDLLKHFKYVALAWEFLLRIGSFKVMLKYHTLLIKYILISTFSAVHYTSYWYIH